MCVFFVCVCATANVCCVGVKFCLLFTCLLQHLEVPLLKPRVSMMVSGVSGGSEQRIRDLFEQAAVRYLCPSFVVCILCIMHSI